MVRPFFIYFYKQVNNMNRPNLSELRGPQFSEKYFKFHYPEFLSYLNNKYPNLNNFQERLYWEEHGLTQHPTCPCGNPVKFESFTKGYRQYCSPRCSNSNKDKISRTKQTCRDRYGADSPAGSQVVKDKIFKTCMDRYGVGCAFQDDKVRQKAKETQQKLYGGQGNASDILKAKRRKTMMERYGAEEYNNREKAKETWKELYGVDHPSRLESVKHKIQDSRRAHELKRQDYLLGYTSDGQWICRCSDPTCNKCTERQYITTPLRYESRITDHLNPCPIANPIQEVKNKNTSIECFVQDVLDEIGVEYITNAPVLGRKHIDVYIPSMQVGFECNGLYHHSSVPGTFAKPTSYHRNKTDIAEKCGIRLYHLWQDWIQLRPELVKSMIINAVHRTPNKIFARKCQLEIINGATNEYKDFFNRNHLQGHASASVCVGLRYNNKIVSAMSFGRRKGTISSGTDWEVIRFCNITFTNIPGAASRLLKHFINTYHPQHIVSYASRDISDGSLYKKLGFQREGSLSQSYWYVEHKTLKRYHRASFSKRELKKRGWLTDDNQTEFEVMNDKPYFRIHDSGQTKWILKCNKKEEPN